MATKHAHHHRHVKHPKHGWKAKSPSVVPPNVQTALRTAMTLEQVPPVEYDDLLWIMAQESWPPDTAARIVVELLMSRRL